MTSSTAVVHLVRRANGIEPFEAFLASYRRHDAGHEHELVLLYKGFETPDELVAHRRLASDLGPAELHVDDAGMDLGAYLTAARQLRHRRFCFVNSYAEILVSGWLDLLTSAARDSGVGVVGATGSWGSHRSFALSLLRLPNGYGGELGDRHALRDALQQAGPATDSPSLSGRIANAARDVPLAIAAHPGFPAPHVRTNAFVVDGELLLSLSAGRLGSKAANYRFESGRGSLTVQLRRRDLATVVVGRDGVAHGPETWPDAEVFWQGTQSGLVVADNQTRAYTRASPAGRDALARYAWGGRARPA